MDAGNNKVVKLVRYTLKLITLVPPLSGLLDKLHEFYSNEANYYPAEDDDVLLNFPVLVQIPTTTSPDGTTLEEMKNRLPVVKFGDYVKSRGCDVDEEICVVCLSCLETGHEMRKLSNCCHVFHKDCLDRWVDQSHITCPTCRSNLFPSQQGDELVLEKMHHHNVTFAWASA